ncbi:hypothetical protein Plhal304r1_c038g0113851 [Plasmopara halstedii]
MQSFIFTLNCASPNTFNRRRCAKISATRIDSIPVNAASSTKPVLPIIIDSLASRTSYRYIVFYRR